MSPLYYLPQHLHQRLNNFLSVELRAGSQSDLPLLPILHRLRDYPDRICVQRLALPVQDLQRSIQPRQSRVLFYILKLHGYPETVETGPTVRVLAAVRQLPELASLVLLSLCVLFADGGENVREMDGIMNTDGHEVETGPQNILETVGQTGPSGYDKAEEEISGLGEFTEGYGDG